MRYKSVWKIVFLFFTLSSVLPLSSAQMQQQILIKSTGTIQMNQNIEDPPVNPAGTIWAWDGTKSQINNIGSNGHTVRNDLIFAVDYQGKRALELRSEDRTDAGGNECPAVRILLPTISSTNEYWSRKLLFIPEENIYEGSGAWYEGLAFGSACYWLFESAQGLEPFSCAGIEIYSSINDLQFYWQRSYDNDNDWGVRDVGTIPKGQWNEIIEHVIIGPPNQGKVEIWLNNELIASQVCTTDITALDGSGPYLEIRNYPCHWCMDQSIYFAEWVIWTE